MLKRGIFTRLEQFRERGEEGVALVSVVILSMVILIIVSSLSITLVQASNLTADNKSQVVTFASAESGTDHALLGAVANSCQESGTSAADGFAFEVYRSASEIAPTGLSDPSLSKGCPRDGDRFITIKSTGTDARGKDSEVISTFRWVIRNLGSTEGAVVAGTGLSNISQLGVYNTDGDLLIEKGNFDCNSNSNIAGDVVVMDGEVRMSNQCKIHGSVYASKNVYINNNAAGVGGSVYTLGDFQMSTSATINGDVRAKGNLNIDSGARIDGSVTGTGTNQTLIDNAVIGGTLSTAGPIRITNNGRVNGSVLSSGDGNAFFFNARVGGDLLLNGRIEQLQSSTIGGNISSSAGGAHAIAPDISTPGWIRVGGTIQTWGAGPQAAQGKFENQTISKRTPPTFTAPEELQPGFFKWRDWDFVESDWTTSGYQIEQLTNCNFQDNPAIVASINAKNTPTVFDLRACSEVKSFGVQFTPRTDVTFIFGTGLKNMQSLKINAAPGTGKHEFVMMVADQTKDSKPSCTGGISQENSINIYGIQMDDNISSFIYSPCMVKFGGNSNINGQIYTGNADYTAGGTTNFDYLEMFIPGFPVEDVAQAPSAFDADATERVLPVLVSRNES